MARYTWVLVGFDGALHNSELLLVKRRSLRECEGPLVAEAV